MKINLVYPIYTDEALQDIVDSVKDFVAELNFQDTSVGLYAMSKMTQDFVDEINSESYESGFAIPSFSDYNFKLVIDDCVEFEIGADASSEGDFYIIGYKLIQ